MCRIPFIVVKYLPDSKQANHLNFTKKKLQLTSIAPLECYGDCTILSKMKLEEIEPSDNHTEVLGPIGKKLPETLKRLHETIKNFQEKYKKIGSVI